MRRSTTQRSPGSQLASRAGGIRGPHGVGGFRGPGATTPAGHPGAPADLFACVGLRAILGKEFVLLRLKRSLPRLKRSLPREVSCFRNPTSSYLEGGPIWVLHRPSMIGVVLYFEHHLMNRGPAPPPLPPPPPLFG